MADPDEHAPPFTLPADVLGGLQRLEYHAVAYSSLTAFAPLIDRTSVVRLKAIEDLSELADLVVLHGPPGATVALSLTALRKAVSAGEREHVALVSTLDVQASSWPRCLQFNGVPSTAGMLPSFDIIYLEMDFDLWPRPGLHSVELPGLRAMCINIPFEFSHTEHGINDAWPMRPDVSNMLAICRPILADLAFRSGWLEHWNDCRDVILDIRDWAPVLEHSLRGVDRVARVHMLHGVELGGEDGDEVPSWVGEILELRTIDGFVEWLEYCVDI